MTRSWKPPGDSVADEGNDEQLTEEQGRQAAADEAQSTETCDRILEETLLDIITLALENGVSEEEVDEALSRVVSDRANRQRSMFRLHRGAVTPLDG